VLQSSQEMTPTARPPLQCLFGLKCKVKSAKERQELNNAEGLIRQT